MQHQDKMLRFLGAVEDWKSSLESFDPADLTLRKFPGDKPEDCVFFYRNCNIDEMESEDDETYTLSTPDGMVQSIYSRFEVRRSLKRLVPSLEEDRIDTIIKMAWNYPRLVINRLDGVFEPFSDLPVSNLPPIPKTGGPPRKRIFID